MLIKPLDDKSALLATLEELLTRPDLTETQRHDIEHELRSLRAGIKGEQESTNLIDFDLKNSKHTAVIHDLRLEIEGRVAQIDHLLVHRTLTLFVLETKYFSAGVKITEGGEFLRWNTHKKTFEGMASPFAQNERHIAVLQDAVGQIEMPTRLGIRLRPSFESYVLVSPSARIDRPKTLDTSRIIKSDMLRQTIERYFDPESLFDTLSSVARFVAAETVEDIAKQLLALHRPMTIDYAARFGLPAVAPTVNAPQTAPTTNPQGSAGASEGARLCRHCGAGRLSVQHGRFGYYFKCAACKGNTPIRVGCGNDTHKERIRKEGKRFFRECVQCGTRSLFFENRP